MIRLTWRSALCAAAKKILDSKPGWRCILRRSGVHCREENKMKSLRSAMMFIAAAGVLALVVSAQQENTGKPQTQGIQNGQMRSEQMMPQGQKMPMREMMRNCRSIMQTMMGSMMQSNDQVKKDIEAAKESNDPARMRAAL